MRRRILLIAPVVTALVAGACAPSRDARIEEVLRRSRAAPEKIVALESPYLADPDRDVRAISAWAIGYAAGPGAASSLAPLVRDPEPAVRRAAVIALCRAGGTESTEPLAALIGDGDVAVRRALARCFVSSSLAPPGGLARLLEDDDKEIRISAVTALVAHPDPEAIDSLAGMLRKREPDEQLAAVAALRALADPGALPALESAAASRLSPSVREPVEAAILELRAILPGPPDAAVRGEKPDR